MRSNQSDMWLQPERPTYSTRSNCHEGGWLSTDLEVPDQTETRLYRTETSCKRPVLTACTSLFWGDGDVRMVNV